MIRRIYWLMILLIVLPDIYIWMHYFYNKSRKINFMFSFLDKRFVHINSQKKHSKLCTFNLRLLWWLPCLVMVGYTIGLSTIRNFAPTDLTWLNLYLLLFGLIVGPKAVFTLFSAFGSLVRRLFHTRYNYGHRIGLVLGIFAVFVYIYGLIFGISKIKVDHVDLYFKDLPKTFDGYRILQISDLHVGTFDGWRKYILENEIDSIRAQKVDMVCFTGDMQNMRPEEVEKLMPVLKRLPYTYFVLGNHDYAQYVRNTPGLEQRMRRKLLSLESRLGKPLCNQNVVIKATNGSVIYLAGEENDGKPPFPARGNQSKTLKGIPDSAFVVLLQHDPSAWKRDILPHSKVQLTLSGHTHGGQMQILGWRPTRRPHQQDFGLYEDHGRYIYVSAGLGGLVPFRLNMPNEITVITLHSKSS